MSKETTLLRQIIEYNELVDDLVGQRMIAMRCLGIDTDPILKIYLTKKGVCSEVIDGEKIVGSGIPALNVHQWDSSSVRYLRDWLYVLLTDKRLETFYQAHFISTEGWRNETV